MARMVRFSMYLSKPEHAAFEHEALEGGYPNVASWMRGACNERVRKHETNLPRSVGELRPVRFEMRLDEVEHAKYQVEVGEEKRASLAEWVRDVCNAKVKRAARRAATG